MNNEEEFIERTILSMIAQTIKPLRWVIVNDNSDDRSSEIIIKYASRHSFMRIVNHTRPPGRHFGYKVHAFNCGLDKIRDFGYELIGNLDADITLESDYYEQILKEFDNDPKLGIAGGMVYTVIEHKYVSQEVSLDSVAGAVQFFRRKCFEQIGGYRALPQGGIDAAAEIMARMIGWKVCTFPDLRVSEQRRTGTATERPIAARILEGKRLYSLGYGFLYFLVRCVHRSLQPPVFIGSAAAIVGFLKAMILKKPILLAPEVVRFLRAEQRGKLLRLIKLSK